MKKYQKNLHKELEGLEKQIKELTTLIKGKTFKKDVSLKEQAVITKQLNQMYMLKATFEQRISFIRKEKVK